MKDTDAIVAAFIKDNGIDAEHMVFDKSCHSVDEAAAAAGVSPSDLVKSICMLDDDDNLIVAIVNGKDRASTSRVAKALGTSRPRIAEPQEVMEITGFPVGGTPPLGFEATFIMDERIFDKKFILAGGGSDRSLIRIRPDELMKANSAKIARVRK